MKQKKYQHEWYYFRGNMEIIILLSSIALVSAASVSPSPRSVNVALETSFLFEPKDINDNISFIKNIKEFLDKLYKILEPQAKSQPTQQFRSEPDHRRFSFLDFIKSAGETVLNYTDKAVSVVGNEVSKITDDAKATIVDVIVPDRSIKNIIKESMNNWRRINSDELRTKIKHTMEEKNPLLISFATKMNNYYNDDDVKKMLKFVRKINRYFEKEIDASKLVQQLLHFGIVDKPKSLNATAKANFINDLNLLSEYVSTKFNKKFKFKLQGPDKNAIESKRKNSESLQSLLGDKENVLDEPNADEVDQIYKDMKKSIGKKLKRAKLREKEHKKGVATNEIVVDNVELIVQTLKNL